MYTLWFVGVMIMLAMDTRTDAMMLKEIEPHRCYQCDGAECDQLALTDLQTMKCPIERPYCATTSAEPNYHTTLSCAFKLDNPCTFIYDEHKISKMSCVCTGHLCNEPFSWEMRKALFNLSSTNNIINITDFLATRKFTNYVHIPDDSEAPVSNPFDIEDDTELATKQIGRAPAAMGQNDVTKKTIGEYPLKALSGPRAAALQQEMPEPSDDDDDDSESSGAGAAGADDELQRPTLESPASPAPPSSYLPPKESVAHPLLFNFLAAIPLFYHFTVWIITIF